MFFVLFLVMYVAALFFSFFFSFIFFILWIVTNNNKSSVSLSPFLHVILRWIYGDRFTYITKQQTAGVVGLVVLKPGIVSCIFQDPHRAGVMLILPGWWGLELSTAETGHSLFWPWLPTTTPHATPPPPPHQHTHLPGAIISVEASSHPFTDSYCSGSLLMGHTPGSIAAAGR